VIEKKNEFSIRTFENLIFLIVFHLKTILWILPPHLTSWTGWLDILKLIRNPRNQLAWCFLEKAFDSVGHKGLLHKLLISNCYLYLTKIIASFLSGRSFHVCVNKTDSATHPIPYGVILSPSLYNFFIADSPQSNLSEIATLADDTAIFVFSEDPGMVCNIL
jgi:hypothetical protein